MIKIESITFKDMTYTIAYSHNDKTYKLIGRINVYADEKIDDEFLQQLYEIDFLSNLNEAFWISRDEYLIVIPKNYQVLPDDDIFPIGTVRHYITNHMDTTYQMSFVSLGFVSDVDNDFDMDDFKNAMFDYGRWNG